VLQRPAERAMKIILVADDDDGVRQVIRTILERPDAYQVLEAEDGLQALELAQREHPALLIIERRLHGLSGDQVCVYLRSDPATRDMPVVMLTTSGHDDVQGYVLTLGAHALLQKPFHPQELVDTVQQLVGG
jgi:CheY-like chemotaxis protein